VESDQIRILMVEDDPDDALLFREMLAEVTAAPPQLVHVERLEAAIERARVEAFDVVLLDLSLPDSRGIETFLDLNRAISGVPIVVLTGLDDETVAVKAVQEGAQDYLLKGQVTGSLLLRSIRYAIERQRTTRYRALLVERERFDAAVAEMTDGIIVSDADWRVTSANRAACLLLNLPEDAWRGTRLDDALGAFALSTPLEETRASDRRAQAFEISRPHTHPPLFIAARLTRLSDPAGKLVSTVLTLRDVTEERREQELRMGFLMMVSHKLRTPLTVLIACLDLCRRLPPERMTKKLAEVLEVCDAEVSRLGEVVQKLLDFKALTSGELEGEGHPVEIGPAIATAADEVRRHYPSRSIEVSTTIAPGAAKAACGREHLDLVLAKLLDNAAKFADKEPVRIAVSVEEEAPSRLRVSVSDNGPGIPHEYYDRIFDGFVQVEDLPTGQVPGLGVGLYMAREVVEAYGGSISVHSEIGEGTTFSFTVPAAAPD
jgi:two-component system cell cycle sensor histidine kinase/response regulator CckA